VVELQVRPALEKMLVIQTEAVALAGVVVLQRVLLQQVSPTPATLEVRVDLHKMEQLVVRAVLLA
jgi:hypothetical protein